MYSPGPNLDLMRYHGFLATVVSTQGNAVLVYITEVGKSKPAGPFWVALDDPAACDSPANKLTTLTPQSQTGTTGLLFLSLGRAGQFGLHLPKLPPAAGDEGITK